MSKESKVSRAEIESIFASESNEVTSPEVKAKLKKSKSKKSIKVNIDQEDEGDEENIRVVEDFDPEPEPEEEEPEEEEPEEEEPEEEEPEEEEPEEEEPEEEELEDFDDFDEEEEVVATREERKLRNLNFGSDEEIGEDEVVATKEIRKEIQEALEEEQVINTEEEVIASKEERKERNFDYEEEEVPMARVCQNLDYLQIDSYREFYNQKLTVVRFIDKNIDKVNYREARRQLNELNVNVNIDNDELLSMDDFNERLGKIFSARCRIIEIKKTALHNYTIYKNALKMLRENLAKRSKEGSSDRRSGEVQDHMADLENDMTLAEAFHRECDLCLDHIDMAYEVCSRQITCLQEVQQELNRGNTPYRKGAPKHDSIYEQNDDDDDDDDDEVQLSARERLRKAYSS